MEETPNQLVEKLRIKYKDELERLESSHDTLVTSEMMDRIEKIIEKMYSVNKEYTLEELTELIHRVNVQEKTLRTLNTQINKFIGEINK